jgi:hypothetical protein
LKTPAKRDCPHKITSALHAYLLLINSGLIELKNKCNWYKIYTNQKMNAALAIAADIHIVLALGQHSSKQYDSSEKVLS